VKDMLSTAWGACEPSRPSGRRRFVTNALGAYALAHRLVAFYVDDLGAVDYAVLTC
jgi:hypothetical protein